LTNGIEGPVRSELARNTKALRTTEFLILSDYVIGDSATPNSVASFTIAPTSVVSDEFDARIEETLPSDIKGAKFVSDAGLELLTGLRLFHINFILDDLKSIASIKSSRLGNR